MSTPRDFGSCVGDDLADSVIRVAGRVLCRACHSRALISHVVGVNARVQIGNAVGQASAQHAAIIVKGVGDEGGVGQGNLRDQRARRRRSTNARIIRVIESPGRGGDRTQAIGRVITVRLRPPGAVGLLEGEGGAQFVGIRVGDGVAIYESNVKC